MAPPAEKRRRLSSAAAVQGAHNLPASYISPLSSQSLPHQPQLPTLSTVAATPMASAYAAGRPFMPLGGSVGAGGSATGSGAGRAAGVSSREGGSLFVNTSTLRPIGEGSASEVSAGSSSRGGASAGAGGTAFSQPFASDGGGAGSLYSPRESPDGDGLRDRRSQQRPRLTSANSNETTSTAGAGPGDELRIEGYRDVQIISVHYDDVVACRAISTTRGDQHVAIKLSLSARPSVATQFKAEAALLARLRDAGVANITKVLARESGRFGAMMVVANEDLYNWYELYNLGNRPPPPYWHDPQSLVRAIENAIKLVRLVASVHKVGIVHGSIRPMTISNSVFGEVHLHDFSCAFQFVGAATEGDALPIRERGMKEESLPYLAPECSGRVGKTADYRSDYYSLGATLFEVFTGQVPFVDAVDPLEVVHAHIARRPVLMSNIDPSVPHALSLIIAKLLEKSPDARYQTSQGLIVDLERVRDLTATIPGATSNSGTGAGTSAGTGRSPQTSTLSPLSVTTTRLGSIGADFVPGSLDEAAYFRLPPASKLFGREDSTRQLRDSFDRVKTSNHSAVVVVKGGSGIGKTSLIETLRTPAVQSRGHFTNVKFDQIKSPVPFFAITQSLSGLFRQLLSESEAQLVVWRRRLSRALGKEARVLADVLPTLEHIFERDWLAEQPAAPVLSPQESNERFQSLVLKVLRAFARAGKPLVVVFDDLQWSTTSDLAFIRSLAHHGGDDEDSPLTSKMASPMLLICCYRDNEVGLDHIVETELLGKLPHVDLTLTLQPLNVQDVSAFIREALRNPSTTAITPTASSTERIDANVQRLSELVLEKTSGSPLFVAQLLKAFNAEGLFTFDFSRGRWQYDLDLISSKSVSTNVVELLLAQMAKYPARTQEALKVAACLGNEELDAHTLAKAANRSLEELSRDVQDAVQEGLLVPFGQISVDPEQRAEEEERKLMELEGSSGGPSPSRRASVDGPAGGAAVGRMASMSGGKKNRHLRPRLEKRKLSIVQKAPVPARYRFFHDRSQQAAYALIPATERSALHYAVGQRIVEQSSEEDVHNAIFDLVQQLNHGIDILSTTEERDRLAYYNFLAGQKANQSTAFEAACKYLSIAWDLLGQGGWVGQHKLMSQVVELLVEVEYSLTDYGAAQEYVRVYLAHSKNDVDKLRVYARSIRCATATGDSVKAIEIGREGLAMVGVVLPETSRDAAIKVDETRKKLALSISAIE
ncbi:hypothetical protein JCM3770_002264, partial [Rhodotorula araucariae]